MKCLRLSWVTTWASILSIATRSLLTCALRSRFHLSSIGALEFSDWIAGPPPLALCSALLFYFSPMRLHIGYCLARDFRLSLASRWRLAAPLGCWLPPP